MARTARRDQTSRRVRWALPLGVVVAVALLAHDALMGAGARAKPATADHPLHRHAFPDRSAHMSGAEVTPSVEFRPSAPGETDDCGQTRPVLPRGDHPDVDDDASATVAGIAEGGRSMPAERWSEPTRPPSQLRALTRVYRI